jgi:hypothetical protein
VPISFGKRTKRDPNIKGEVRAGGVTQVVEHLPAKPEALSSNPVPKKERSPQQMRLKIHIQREKRKPGECGVEHPRKSLFLRRMLLRT